MEVIAEEKLKEAGAESLDHDTLLKLIKAAQNGDEEARERVILSNMKLVYSIAHKMKGRALKLGGLEEAVSIGIVGLIKAVEKFDTEYGVKFSTYAVPMIKGEILRHVRDHSDLIKVSRSIRDIMFKMINNNLTMETPEEIAEKLDVDIDMVKTAIGYLIDREALSMDSTLFTPNDGSTPITLEETVQDHRHDDWESKLLIEDIVSRLPERLRSVVDMCIFKDMTQQAVGNELGISQVQVSRRLDKAVNLLKTEWSKSELDTSLCLPDSDAKYTHSTKRTSRPKQTKEEVTVNNSGKSGKGSGNHRRRRGSGRGDRDKAIHLLKTTNMTQTEISKITGVPTGSLGTLAKGIRKNRKDLLKGDRETAMELVKTTSLTQQEIAARTGVPEGTLAAWCLKHRNRNVAVENVSRGIKARSERNRNSKVKDKGAEVPAPKKPELNKTAGSAEVAASKLASAAASEKSVINEGTEFNFNFNLGANGNEVTNSHAIAELMRVIDILEKVPTTKVTYNIALENKAKEAVK